MQIPAFIYHEGEPGTTLRGGLPDPVVPPVGGTVTTMRLTNPTDSEQAAGFVSKMVGLPFKQGDMPAGDWPLLTVGADVPCPATNWSAVTWPDGSLKWVGCMARIPAAVPANSSIDVLVKRGGTLDTTPSRTTADLTAADLKTELTGTLNLDGRWTASLNDGITTGPVVLLGNGPAGALWRIGSEYRDSLDAAHGQLYQHHFVAGLTNASGGVAGLRYLGRAMQMWGDYSAVTPTRRTFTARLLSGAATLRDIVASQNVAGTPGATVDMAHWSSWYTCGGDGEYDFIPGTQAEECAVYWEHDPEYVATSGVVPRMDTAIEATPMAEVDYIAYGKGNFQQYGISGATIKSEIGAMNRFAAIHLINQGQSALRTAIVNGLVIGGLTIRAISKVNHSVIPCVDLQPSYTGMNTPDNGLRFDDRRINRGSLNIVNPVDKTSLWGAPEPAHMPGTSWYPYAVTGRPEFLDQITESAAYVIMTLATGASTLRTDFPLPAITTGGSSTSRTAILNGVTYKGAGWFCRTELPRMLSWSIREMGHVAAFYPDVCPRGTQTRQYFRDLVNRTLDLALDYRDAMVAVGHTEYASEGHHFFQQAATSLWSNGDLSMTICHLADIYPTAKMIEWRQHLGKLWNAVAAETDMACPAAYVCNIYTPEGRIVTVSDMTYSTYNHMACSFNVDTDRVTVIGTIPWIPTEGDRFSFNATNPSYQPFAIANTLQVFYAVNVDGNSFQLSETRGGAPIPITNGSASTIAFKCGLQNYPATYSLQRNPDTEGYFATIRAAVLCHRASGDDVAVAHAEVQAKVPLVTVNYGINPKYAYEGASNTSGV